MTRLHWYWLCARGARASLAPKSGVEDSPEFGNNYIAPTHWPITTGHEGARTVTPWTARGTQNIHFRLIYAPYTSPRAVTADRAVTPAATTDRAVTSAAAATTDACGLATGSVAAGRARGGVGHLEQANARATSKIPHTHGRIEG